MGFRVKNRFSYKHVHNVVYVYLEEEYNWYLGYIQAQCIKITKEISFYRYVIDLLKRSRSCSFAKGHLSEKKTNMSSVDCVN